MVLGAVLVLGIGNLARLQEARFLAAVDSMSDALILTDAANTVIHVNPAACELLNANADTLEGKPLAGVSRSRSNWRRPRRRLTRAVPGRRSLRLAPKPC